MKRLLFAMLAALVVAASFGARPPIKDKSGIARRICTHANPWYPIAMAPVHDDGGPDRTWEYFKGTNHWRRCMEVCQSYGVDTIMIEMGEGTGRSPEFRELLDNCPPGFKIGMFFGFHMADKEKTAKAVIALLNQFRNDLLNSDKVLRVEGKPVMILYRAAVKPLDYYQHVFSEIERAICPMVFLYTHSNFLMNCYFGGGGDLETKMRKYLEEFDGITDYSYSYSTPREHKMIAGIVRKLRKEFPDKIYMGTPHMLWTQHFVQSGIDKHLSRDWRASVDLWLGEDPDGLELTNLTDHYEHSNAYPSYEREDLAFRYLEYAVSTKWAGRKFRAEKKPELVLCNTVSVALGWNALDFEVLGFPIDSGEKEVTVGIELCDTSGEVLERLGPRKFTLDGFCEAQFSVPSLRFASERGVVPRLVYKWKGQKYRMNYNPMTYISPSMRQTRGYWARSTRNQLELDENSQTGWTLDGVGPGGTRVPSADGQAVFSAAVRPRKGRGWAQGVQRFGILRDGLEFFFTENLRHAMSGTFAWTLPPGGAALHWYNVEMQNANGCRYMSLPIWEDAGKRPGKCTMPVLDGTNGIVRVEVENVRVPFFHWPCSRDGGRILIDASGYMHNGSVCCSDAPGSPWDLMNGELPFVGYNYYHNGMVTPPKGFHTPFDRENGRGYLKFDGNHFITVMGGVAFPGAATYEISIRPDRLGERMGVFDTKHAHVRLVVLPDGRLSLKRRSAPPKGADQFAFAYPEVKSEKPLEVGKWTRVAAVYDLERISLYVDGKKQGEAPCRPNYVPLTYESMVDPTVEKPKTPNPNTSHDGHNGLVIGGEKDPGGRENKAANRFVGGIRQIRVYGRALKPGEML